MVGTRNTSDSSPASHQELAARIAQAQLDEINERRARDQRAAELSEERALELHNRELARLTAPVTPATATRQDDDEEGEPLPPGADFVLHRVPGVPPKEVLLIFHGKFKPEHLIRLCSRTRSTDTATATSLEDGTLVTRKGVDKKQFSEYAVWEEGFLIYRALLTQVCPHPPQLHAAIDLWHQQVVLWNITYQWHALLDLLLDTHSEIIRKGHTEPANWIFPPEYSTRYLTPQAYRPSTSLSSLSSGKRLRAATTTPETCFKWIRGACEGKRG
ncbi:hypothetical protein K402DRAFT_459424 [Aulographum hederae CBS 113979]|uniref:Uncharacterized protein n=1 Tax=Aulographum hederae CBS 113979 TaxID=1176131 RepID=A0A6G1HEG0_9PEZI|nr:hypothetical protein K402DRAFT_459424 [Aulographum hederae CBS 113979]